MTRGASRHSGGFTITELVVVIIIASILAAFAVARINTRSFEAEGFANQLAATMRYAQKIAIAQHRNVAVAITSGTVSLTYPGLSGTPALHRPPGTEAYTLTVPTAKGVTLGGTLVGDTVTFSPLGKPTTLVLPANTNGTLIVSGGDIAPITITVEAETGYVH
jgi:MSHA pilin protein MshC